MKILITGGNGFIGSYVTRALLKRDEEVAIYSTFRKSSLATDIITSVSNRKYLTIIKGDITDAESLINASLSYRPDIIIHLAAITGIKRCFENPSESFTVNVYGTYNSVLAALKSGAKLIFASSREVYGETRGKESSEDDPTTPNNLYGLTKLLGEEIIKWARKKHGLDFTIFRITSVYGPGGDKYNIQAMILKALREGIIEVLGGSQVLNLVYVEDVAEAVLASLYNEKSSGEIFNIGSYDNITVKELVQRITKILTQFGKDVRIIEMPYRPSETIFFKPNISKIAKILGWRPQTDLNIGLFRTIEYYLKLQVSKQ